MNVSNNNLTEEPQTVNNNFEYEMKMKIIKEEMGKGLKRYCTTMQYLAADAPISILGLDKAIENALIRHGCLRVYDLFNLDFTKVKGLGNTRIAELTACFNEFLAMF